MEEPWLAEPNIDLDAQGEPTAESALRQFLEQWQEIFGGEVAMVGEDQAALILDGAEVVVAYPTRASPGGFAVTGAAGCDGYEPDVLPGPPSADHPTPITAPRVTSSSTVERLAASTTASVSTATMAPSTPLGSPPPPRTLQDPDAEGCIGALVVELVSDSDRSEMDLIHYQETSATCGYNADGDAMFDDAFRPATALDALDGELAIATGFQAEVSVDIRPFEPPMRLTAINPSPDILAAASDGTYPVAVSGTGCFVITVAWSADITETSGREGMYTGLSETHPGACDP